MTYDVVVVGASFAGIAVAREAAARGLKVAVLERKSDVGKGINTTGILVEEAAELLMPPQHLIKKISEIRLYSPALKSLEIAANRYFFLSTDTPNLLRHYVQTATREGVTVLTDTPFACALERRGAVWINGGELAAKMLVGADGPRSRVAQMFNLDRNTRFLTGAEAEFTGVDLENPNAFYCFLDRRYAHGYIGWAIPGIAITQVGVACASGKPDVRGFMARVAPVMKSDDALLLSNRGGLIPVGGILRRTFGERVVLIGDAAGTVSPLTAGGIHHAIHYGRRLGELLADYLYTDGPHPGPALMREYPSFAGKLAARAALEAAPNWAFNAMIGSPLFEAAARHVFFMKKRVPGRKPLARVVSDSGEGKPDSGAQIRPSKIR